MNDLLQTGENDLAFKIINFAFLDIDNDNDKELLLNIGFENNIIFTEILKIADG
jgi:hypothetical protein